MRNALARLFGLIQGRKNTLPTTGVLVVDDTPGPFPVVAAEPMAVVTVAENDDDITDYQAQGYDRFIDARDNLLYEASGSGYTTRPYYGEEPFFRPMTLCFSPSRKKLYYADDGLRISVANVGDSPYVQPILYINRINGVTTQLTNAVTVRRRHTMTMYQGNIYLLGGQSGSSASNQLWRYNVSSDTWTQLANHPTDIVDHTTVMVNGQLWVYGGSQVQSGTPVNKLRRYDIATNTWTTLPNGPVAVQHHVSAVDAQGRIYIHGGTTTSGRSALFYRYSPSTGNWENLNNDVPALREHTMTEIDNSLYVFGGDDSTGYRDRLWRYDVNSDMWELMNTANKPPTKNRHAAGAYNGRLYIFGGNGGAFEEDRHNDLWEYNPADRTWREVLLKFSTGAPTTIPIRQVPAYVMLDGVFYFHGGNAIVNGTSEGFSNDFWKIE